MTRLLALAAASAAASFGQCADQPQWGQAWTRNQVSFETGLPETFDPASGVNIKWRARLGTEAHSTPVVAGGRVYIGTNNQQPRDPKHVGDRGVLMCLREASGQLLWQLVVPKRHEDPYFDWPNSGISSPATVEGDHVYIVSNRGEVLCLDARGLENGNDGPFRDEAAHMTPPADAGQPPRPVQGAPIHPSSSHSVVTQQRLDGPAQDLRLLEPGPLDADILWVFDMVEGAGIWPHDGAHSSIVIRGNHLYLNTGTGVDNTHKRIRRPDAPSLIVLDKRSGRLLAREQEGIAPNIFHCTWSAPSMGVVRGREFIFFAAGNGIVYAFEPLDADPPAGQIARLRKIWQFDMDPDAPKSNVHFFHGNKLEGPSNVYGLPVFHEGRLYVAGGGDLWWGKNEAWLKCIDAAGEGDVTRSGLLWAARLGRHVFSTPAVYGDLVFQADTSRFVYCFEADSGALVWQHEGQGEFWASPYVADGKVYIGSRRGDFWVFDASREKRIRAQLNLGAPISATAVAANRTLYVATMLELFAVALH